MNYLKKQFLPQIPKGPKATEAQRKNNKSHSGLIQEKFLFYPVYPIHPGKFGFSGLAFLRACAL
jgi:hypothetical protein